MASLYVAALKDHRTMSEIESTVETLPSGIDAMYIKTLERINNQTPEIAAIALMAILWVTHAKQPLHIRELEEALATSYQVGSLSIGAYYLEAIIDRDLILAICAGLLVLENSGEVRLIRESASRFANVQVD